MNNKGQEEVGYAILMIFVVILIIAMIIGAIYLLKSTGPWWAKKTGQSELAQAEQNRQIAVLEATAKYESSIKLAQVEIERAKGVAEANKIIAGSIDDRYLKYLFVQGLQTNQMQTIYVPTNNFMPVYDMNNIPK